MRKLRKNKFVILVITIVVIILAYFGIQKAIDSYIFRTNSDISTEDKISEEDSLDSKNETKEDLNQGKYSDEEMNVVLEDEIAMSDLNAENLGDDTGINNSNGSDDTNSLKNKIYVYITGEVNVPGVVILNEGSRIVDAINSAGGTTSKANISKVNLVYVLEDGMKVNIPNDNDLKNNPDFEYITMNSGDGRNDSTPKNSNTANSSDSGKTQETKSKYSIVNINTATQTELETLPGIGPSLALKIINYRIENGKFSSIEEIKNVSGIGESKYEEMKNYITV